MEESDLILSVSITNMGLGVERSVLSAEIGNEEFVVGVLSLLLESITSKKSGWWS